MADEWVSVRAMLTEDPKTITITECLKKHKPFRDWLGVAPDKMNSEALCSVTLSALVRVWSIANSRGVPDEMDVVLAHAGLSWVDRIGKVPGLSKAMEAVHWIAEEQRNGVTFLRFPNFLEYNFPIEVRSEKEAKEREQNRVRQQRYRDNKRARNGRVTPNNAPTATAQHSTAQDTNAAATALDMDRGCGGKDFSKTPSEFLSTLDTILGMLQVVDQADQIGFLGQLAYADSTGVEFPGGSLWDYIGRAKTTRRKSIPNPAGYLKKSLRDDFGPDGWAAFQSAVPSEGQCQAMFEKACKESIG